MAASGSGKRCAQGGAALVTSLVVMLVALMIGVAAARAAIHGERSARVERDRHIALSAAEAALADAERDIEAASSPGRAALFAAGLAPVAQGCGRGVDDLGLCAVTAGAPEPQWQLVDLLHDQLASVAFGAFTGARMQAGAGPLPARAPRYLIEFVPVAGATAASGQFFRITAFGFGARASTRVVLQSFYRKPPAAALPVPGAGTTGGAATPAPGTTLPAGRIAWREVANWPQLHLAAIE
jgi:Tfp pilus assembly protein PilX